ncbi:MAG: tetratricopeptide repeat protein [Crocinitomicaceae bacterium]|nr:tetratricopeptide repeat protein [Crocinitomicaceae bacterium]
MKKLLFLFVLIFNVTASHACLNYYYSIDNQGHFHDGEAEDLRRAFNTNFNTSRLEKNLKKLQLKLEASKDYKLLSDYAVLLLKAGKTAIALDILEQLSLKHPNDYQIAANLGTAYELSGNNEKALEYIKRGIELNPDSHGGSEWVHVKLLEAKLKLADDPSYLDSITVLNLTEAQKKDKKVRDQLTIQIRERFPFCKGPDPIMASLLIDLGDCYANTVSLEFAKASYEIAKHYYKASDDIVDPKIDEAKYMLRQYIGVTLDARRLRMESEHREGEHNRMSQIRYQKLLDDNNPSEYEIDWSNVQSNADTLLALAEIERVIPEPEEVEEEIAPQPEKKANPDKKESSSLNWIYFLIAGVAVGGGAIYLYSRRKK